jgi:hypothetical protein
LLLRDDNSSKNQQNFGIFLAEKIHFYATIVIILKARAKAVNLSSQKETFWTKIESSILVYISLVDLLTFLANI